MGTDKNPEEMVTIRLRINTGYPGAGYEDEVEMTRYEWESMPEEEREAMAQEYMWEYIECSATLVEDDKDGD